MEIIIVSVNLLVLLGLGIAGLAQWDTNELTAGIEPRQPWSALVGGAAIFMAYEGFQLLTYEYDKIEKPEKKFMPTLLSAVAFVVIVYVIVSIGAAMLGGALPLIHYKQVALSIAAEKKFGMVGLVVLTVAAGFATAAAINSTLFSTASLSKSIAKRGELPPWFNHTNGNGVPDRSIILLGSIAGLLAVIGSLGSLVEAASLIFLITFSTVNFLAWKKLEKNKWIPMTGMVMGAIIGLALLGRLIITKPVALGAMLAISLFIILGRPYLLKISGNKSNKKGGDDD